MAPTDCATDQVLEFKKIDVSTKSVYIVEGSNKYEVYNINKAVNPANKEKLLLFILRGSLQKAGKIDFRAWDEWKNCSKATYATMENDEQGKVLVITFDVNKYLTTPTHQVRYPENKEGVQQCVDQSKAMFIIKEKDFRISESEFPMKMKRDKATREMQNIISINCTHILEKKTPIIEKSFLSDEEKPFVTRIQILDKSEKEKKTNKRKLDSSDNNDTKKKTKTEAAPINLIEKVKNLMAKSSKDKKEEKYTKEWKEKENTEESSKTNEAMSENWSKKLEENQEEALLENEGKPLTLTQENMLVMGIKLPLRDLTTEDTKSPPWTNLSRNLYREKKRMFDNKYASKWMRWWFEEHHQMPEAPDNPPRSGYAIYMYEKQTELGGFNNKKITKKIATAWTQESEDVKSVYKKRCDEQKEQHEKLSDSYEEDIENWQKKKQSKPKRSDGMPDCNCQYCIEEET